MLEKKEEITILSNQNGIASFSALPLDTYEIEIRESNCYKAFK